MVVMMHLDPVHLRPRGPPQGTADHYQEDADQDAGHTLPAVSSLSSANKMRAADRVGSGLHPVIRRIVVFQEFLNRFDRAVWQNALSL